MRFAAAVCSDAVPRGIGLCERSSLNDKLGGNAMNNEQKDKIMQANKAISRFKSFWCCPYTLILLSPWQADFDHLSSEFF